MPGSPNGLAGVRAWPLQVALILCLALLVRLAFACGYQGQDDKHYIFTAATFALDGRVPLEVPNLWVTRIGHWLPIAGLVRLLGLGEWVVCLYALACSIASVALVFFTGRVVVSERAALLAALLAAVFPLEACYATTAYVDLPVAFFMLLALHLVLLGHRERRTYRFFLAGLAVGWAYLCRETTALILVPLGVYYLRHRWSGGQFRALIAGFVLLLMAESVFWGMAAGDPVYRYRQAAEKIQQVTMDHASVRETTADPMMGWLPGPEPGSMRRSTNSLLDFGLMFATNEEFGLFGPVVWSMILVGLLWRRPDPWELVVWVVGMALLIGFVPWRFPYTLARDPRYYACLTGPMVLLIAHRLMRWSAPLRYLAVFALALTSLLGLLITQPTRQHPVERAFAELVPRYRDGELYVSPELNSFLTVYSGVTRPTGVTIHLLEEGSRSDSWHALRALWPDAPFVMGVSEIKRGYVASFRPVDPARLPRGWRDILVLTTPVPPLTSRAMSLLGRAGVPVHMTRRLLPGQGRSIYLYAVD